MSYEPFIGKEIINSKNQVGVVVSIDDDYVVIKYDDTTKTYNRNVAFKSGFLKFKEDNLNKIIDDDLALLEEEARKKEERINENKKVIIERRNRVNKIFKQLSMKNTVMKQLFGSDFEYPPYVEFKKKYKYLIKDDRLDLFDLCHFSHYLIYYAD